MAKPASLDVATLAYVIEILDREGFPRSAFRITTLRNAAEKAAAAVPVASVTPIKPIQISAKPVVPGPAA